MGKTVPEVLSTARGRRPRAVLKTEGTVLPNADRPRPANNVFTFFLLYLFGKDSWKDCVENLSKHARSRSAGEAKNKLQQE